MYLYNLTIQKETGINSAITGSFTAAKTSEIVVSRGNILELFSIDENKYFYFYII